MADYYWKEGSSGDFDDPQNWYKLQGSKLIPAKASPKPTDAAHLTSSGSANVDGNLITQDSGNFTSSIAMTVAGRLMVGTSGTSTSSFGGGKTMDIGNGVVLGSSAGSNGFFYVQNFHSTVNTGSSPVTIGASGHGDLVVQTFGIFNGAGSTVVLGKEASGSGSIFVSSNSSLSALTLKIGQKGSGNVSVSGTSAKLTASTIAVGAKTATATGNPDNPWTYSKGGGGSIGVSSNGSVADDGSLTLLGGTINITGGGRMEVGGHGTLNANTLKIDAGKSLTGFGSINSDPKSKVNVGSKARVDTWSLSVTVDGTIEAKNGTLTIKGDIKSSGGDGAHAKIDDNATLEIGGKFDGVIDFQHDGQESGHSKLIIDNPTAIVDQSKAHNYLRVKSLAVGDSIVLTNTSFGNGNGITSATIVADDE